MKRPISRFLLSQLQRGGHKRAVRRARSVLLVSMVATAFSAGCDVDQLSVLEAGLRINPERLDFADTYVGTETVRNLVVSNSGETVLRLESTRLVSASGTFSLPATGTFPLSPDDNTAMTVAFSPNEAGPHAAELELTFDGFDPLRIPLAGEAVLPAIRLEPATLDFGEVDAADASTQTLSLINDGTEPFTVQLSVLNSAAYTLATGTDTQAVVLPAGATEALQVRFTPPGAGVFSATLRADVCGEGCGVAATLTGTGRAPRIEVDPRQVDLGVVEPGSTTTTTVTVRNVGVGDLNISTVALDDALGFASVTSPVPGPLAPGDDAEVSIAFSPTTPEASFSANLVVESNDPLQPRLLVPVVGQVPGAMVRVFPAVMQFGLLDEGDVRQQDALVRSVGDRDVSVTAVRIVGDTTGVFSLASPLPLFPFSLAPQESLLTSLQVNVTADAFQALGAEAELVIESSAGEVRVPMAFSADVSACRPRAVRSHVQLGFVDPGLGARGTTEIVNEGTAGCTVRRVTPANGREFDAGFTYQSWGPDVLMPGDNMVIEFAFSTSRLGDYRAFLAAQFDESESDVVVSASATTLPNGVRVNPSSVQVGPVQQGCGVPEVNYVLTNIGAINLQATQTTIVGDAVTSVFPQPPFALPVGVWRTMTLRWANNLPPGLHTATVLHETDSASPASLNVELDVAAADESVTERFIAPGGTVTQVDVLFIVDNSGSMQDDQEELAENFEAFVEAAQASANNLDVQIGLTTTDVSVERGGLVGFPEVLDLADSRTPQRFRDRANVGVYGSGWEQGLEAARLALSTSGPNAGSGFLRSDAALSIIVVSDEDDFSVRQDQPQNAEFIELTPTAAYIDILRAVKSTTVAEVPVLVSAVVPLGASRYREVVNAFGGVALNVNQPWGEELADIGEATVELARSFTLASRPEGQVYVTVDGAPTSDFVVEDRTLTFSEPLAEGAEVEVTYDPGC